MAWCSRGATTTSPTGMRWRTTWPGEYPWQNAKLDGYEGTSPVGSFPASGYGLYDMTDNVWEWTRDWFTTTHAAEVEATSCAPVTAPEATSAQARPGEPIPRRVTKGGSPVRSELLPALSTRSPASARDRLVDDAPRLPLHRASLG